ncbi:MAG: biotin/lipoyl-containing protein, partial [Peptostreptococcaceae bacterium]
MNFNEVKELIELINNSDLSYFEIQDEKDYIKMDKSISRGYINSSNENIDTVGLNKVAITDVSDSLQLEKSNKFTSLNIENKLNLQKESLLSDDTDDADFDYIKSPIVGTYYEAISPEEDSFVSIGQKVSKGEVVCIIEAMKLMNEISVEFDCEIVSILGKNGTMVEYGEPLFKVRRI